MGAIFDRLNQHEGVNGHVPIADRMKNNTNLKELALRVSVTVTHWVTLPRSQAELNDMGRTLMCACPREEQLLNEWHAEGIV
jgi:hypothetical protein